MIVEVRRPNLVDLDPLQSSVVFEYTYFLVFKFVLELLFSLCSEIKKCFCNI